jgi:antitoxin component of RelBE/YafQ-DinJ toxin-antitoxin module
VKNITVTVDDETYRRSRIKAAEAGTSVSAVVKSFLFQFAQGQAGESEFDRLKRLQQETLAAIRARAGGFRASDNVSRDALHDRDALR